MISRNTCMHVFHVIFFALTHDGKFSLGEHPVFSKEEKGGTEGNTSAVRGLGYGKFGLS